MDFLARLVLLLVTTAVTRLFGKVFQSRTQNKRFKTRYFTITCLWSMWHTKKSRDPWDPCIPLWELMIQFHVHFTPSYGCKSNVSKPHRLVLTVDRGDRFQYDTTMKQRRSDREHKVYTRESPGMGKSHLFQGRPGEMQGHPEQLKWRRSNVTSRSFFASFLEELVESCDVELKMALLGKLFQQHRGKNQRSSTTKWYGTELSKE